MKIDVRHSPAYSVAYCHMAVGEIMRAEAGAMIAMSGGIQVQADAGPGGVAKGLLRKVFVGEGLFMTRFTSQAHGAWVALASKYPGDIIPITIGGDTSRGIVAEAGSLLALSDGLEADPRWAGVQMVAMREGATMIRIHPNRGAHGHVLLAAYGGIEPFDLADGQTLVFDSGHVVAFTEGMKVRVGPLAGLVTSALSGEGLVAEITGPGRVWTQTRSVIDAHSWLFPKKTAGHGHRRGR